MRRTIAIKFLVEIDCSTLGGHDQRCEEISRLLRLIAIRVDAGLLTSSGRLVNTNGAEVGFYRMSGVRR